MADEEVPRYPGRFVWHELVTTDVKKAKAFYTQLFDWKVAEEKLGDGRERRQGLERVGEVPFTSERRRMSTVHRGTGSDGATEYVLSAKGAPDVILERCTHERRDGHTVELTDERRRTIEEDAERLADDALRTIAVGYRRLADHDAGRELTDDDEGEPPEHVAEPRIDRRLAGHDRDVFDEHLGVLDGGLAHDAPASRMP